MSTATAVPGRSGRRRSGLHRGSAYCFPGRACGVAVHPVRTGRPRARGRRSPQCRMAGCGTGRGTVRRRPPRRRSRLLRRCPEVDRARVRVLCRAALRRGRLAAYGACVRHSRRGRTRPRICGATSPNTAGPPAAARPAAQVGQGADGAEGPTRSRTSHPGRSPSPGESGRVRARNRNRGGTVPGESTPGPCSGEQHTGSFAHRRSYRQPATGGE